MVQKNFAKPPVRGGERTRQRNVTGGKGALSKGLPPLPVTKQALKPKKRLYVLDTNVFMHDPSCLYRFQEHDLYLTRIVFEELDNNKKGNTEHARNARDVCRTIDALLSKNKGPIKDGIALYEASGKIASGRLFFQTKDFAVVDKETKADNQILAVVMSLAEAYKSTHEVVLVSKDTNMRTKGRLEEIAVEDYHNDMVIEDSDLLYSGSTALPSHFWDKVAGMTHEKSGPHTSVTTPHELTRKLFVNEFAYNQGGKQAVRVIKKEGNLSCLQFVTDYGAEKHKVSGINARNQEQNFALNLLMDPNVDLVSLLGPAGCGKTLMALAAAIAQTEKDLYSEIIITRATVSTGDEIGFLPGNEFEKMNPWMGALSDNLEVIAENLPNHKKNDNSSKTRGQPVTEWSFSDKIMHLTSLVKIKSMGFMRGRTFLGKFVIVDESQNLTPKQMKTMITRAGPGTKMVCLGNLSQIDTPYLTEGGSGLTYAVDKFKDWDYSGHIIMPKGERSRLANAANERL